MPDDAGAAPFWFELVGLVQVRATVLVEPLQPLPQPLCWDAPVAEHRPVNAAVA